MDIETEILLNQLAQGVKPLAGGSEWFDRLPVSQQRQTLEGLASFILQAQVAGRHARPAVERSMLRETLTPCVLLLKAESEPLSGRLMRQQLAKILTTPPSEYSRIFILFLSLFGVVDAERRSTEVGEEERHWWHRDLSDPRVLDEIRKKGEPT